MISACSTPCDAPGRLCAPISSITSAPAPRAVPAAAAEAAEAPAQTFRVDSPDLAAPPARTAPAAARNGAPVRIGLLLPLRSDTLGQAAASLRAGFMAAYERDRDGFAVSVIDSGEAAQDALASYAQAQEQHDILVGPLARSAVTAVAASALVRKPTIALNYPEGRGTAAETALPPAMLAMGLSIEDEARQAAAWAAAEQPGARALILTGSAPWQRRIAAAFAAQWQRLGRSADNVDMSALNGYLSDSELVQLRARVQAHPPGLLFAALDADQARQLRVALGADLPLYGTSSLNPGAGRGEAGPAMDGVRLLDLPWQVQRDHPAVMVYPQPLGGDGRRPTADMERLYALGIDAFRVAREIALHPASRFTLDGVTGKLAISFGQGAAQFERVEQTATYKNGVLAPLPATAP
ncbi:penicillin-binding protein activator [Janthinobacterium fluminis]|uniref:Penicillin-binding protein activator n=1 Tax=Janthinobacterium fluminis TaxID=2987524 RepID=A0ABT5JZM4_9BURK|nr:penicillin-binding protein activator [Janthinobacterium fluminis]MDC8757926.1 penicillin-binding protein activator [Janthinobacterium fluminis]